ncbi:MAG: radical SAM protein [Chitinispirillia bacterium]|nr:radical SAM protein [Chitinispirillia bacterium]MCL2268143.1 radical SAM protein [Chitinispirillia bacterium]
MKPIYPHAIVIVTLACNLKCRLCILCVPYYARQWHPTLEYIKETTDRAFAVGDYQIFEFNGGEPFLRDDLPEIFEHALRYKDNVTERFKLVTNGTKLPDRELLKVWKKYGDKFFCIIDHYGHDLSPNAPKVCEMIKNEGIPCELRDMYTENKHHGGWANFMADGVKHTQAEAEKIYAGCGQAKKLLHCCNIINGLLMPCHLQFQLNDKGICAPEPHEFIDLFDDDEPIEVKREKMAGFQTVKSLTACRYCTGLLENMKRFTPGEQMSEDEYRSAPKISTNKNKVES